MKRLSVILSKEQAGTFGRGSPVIILTEGQAPERGRVEEGQGRQSHIWVNGACMMSSAHQPVMTTAPISIHESLPSGC